MPGCTHHLLLPSARPAGYAARPYRRQLPYPFALPHTCHYHSGPTYPLLTPPPLTPAVGTQAGMAAIAGLRLPLFAFPSLPYPPFHLPLPLYIVPSRAWFVIPTRPLPRPPHRACYTCHMPHTGYRYAPAPCLGSPPAFSYPSPAIRCCLVPTFHTEIACADLTQPPPTPYVCVDYYAYGLPAYVPIGSSHYGWTDDACAVPPFPTAPACPPPAYHGHLCFPFHLIPPRAQAPHLRHMPCG